MEQTRPHAPFALHAIPWGPAIGALFVGALFLMAHVRPEQFIQDDSYFYLQIAHNVAAGFGSTFNRITPTNGYHPLWELMCAALAWVARGDKGTLLHLVLGVQQILFLGTWLLLGRVVAGPSAPSRRWLLLPVLAYGFLFLRTYASEAFLFAFVLAGALFVLQRDWGAFDVWRSFRFGLLAGVAFLSRLDSIFLLGALGIASLAASRDRSPSRLVVLLLAQVAGALIVASPYLAFNYFAFGHLVPISGAMKSTFPLPGFDLMMLGFHGRASLSFAVLLLLVLLWRRPLATHRLVLLPLVAGTILHATYVVVFTDHDAGWLWYYVPGVMCGAIATWIVGSEGWPAPAVRWASALVLLVGLVAAAARNVPEALGRGPLPLRWQVRAALYLAETVPPGVGVAVADWPGIFAFYSNRPIHSLDGLMSDYHYDDDLLREGIVEYLRARGIRYYVGFEHRYPRIRKGHDNVIREGVQEVTVYAPLSRKPAGVLRLPDASQVGRFAELFPGKDARGWSMALWKLEDQTLQRGRD